MVSSVLSSSHILTDAGLFGTSRAARRITDVTAPEISACLNFLYKEYIVTGRKAKIENGHPSITPTAETATTAAGSSRRNKPDARDCIHRE